MKTAFDKRSSSRRGKIVTGTNVAWTIVILPVVTRSMCKLEFCRFWYILVSVVLLIVVTGGEQSQLLVLLTWSGLLELDWRLPIACVKTVWKRR